MTTFIHVNRGTIDSNRKHGTNEPAIRFQKGPTRQAHLRPPGRDPGGPSRFVYSAHDPLLPCGARMVIETEAEVKVVR